MLAAVFQKLWPVLKNVVWNFLYFSAVMDIVAGNRTLPPFAAPEDVDYYVTGTDPEKRA